MVGQRPAPAVTKHKAVFHKGASVDGIASAALLLQSVTVFDFKVTRDGRVKPTSDGLLLIMKSPPM